MNNTQSYNEENSDIENVKNIIQSAVKEIGLDRINLDTGIYESEPFAEFDDGIEISLGISRETRDKTMEACNISSKEIYIYNLFYGDEYINITSGGMETNKFPTEVIDSIVNQLAETEKTFPIHYKNPSAVNVKKSSFERD